MLADFAQLTPERAATLTVDPFLRGRLRLAVSGPAPRGPLPTPRDASLRRPNAIQVTVQQRDPSLVSDLAWLPSDDFAIDTDPVDPKHPDPDFILWSGSLRYLRAAPPLEATRYRVMITEHEVMNVSIRRRRWASRSA